MRRLLSILAILAAILMTPAVGASKDEPTTLTPGADLEWRARAKERSQRSIFLFVTQQIATAMFLATLALRGGAVQLRNRVERRISRRWLRDSIYIGLTLLMLAVVALPFSAGRFLLSRLYGVATQSAASWLGDYALATVIDLAVLVVIGVAFYRLADRKPRTWWRWASVAAVPIAVVAVASGPLYMSLFNDFKPIADRALAGSILQLAESDGIPAQDVYQIDLGRRTRAPNAFVSGIGPTAIVALGDNLLAQFTYEEILFVTAHEMGHYVGNHIWKGLGIGCLLAVVSLWLLQVLARLALTHFHDRLRIDDISDIASLPLLLLLSGCLMAAGLPLLNVVSRSFEVESDRFALERTVPELVPYAAAESTFERLGMLSLSDPAPSPVVQFWLGTHPSIDDRVDAIRRYRHRRGE